MQQIDDLIKWAKERLEDNCQPDADPFEEMVANFISRLLLPKLESCKTSPNSNSTPCPSCGSPMEDITVSQCTNRRCGNRYGG